MRAAVSLLALCILLVPCVQRAEAAPYGATDERLRTELVAALTELGTWCVKKQLFGARDALAETILTIHPDDPKARGWLRYKKRKDGSWHRKEPHKTPKNRKPAELPEFEQRRRAIFEALRPRVIAAIRNAKPPLTLFERADAVDAWRPLLGDDPALMALAGRKQHDGRWRDIATVRSLERRAAIAAAAKAGLKEHPKIGPRKMPDAARGIDLPWKEGRGTARVAAFGTPSTSILESAVRVVHATEALLEAQFGGTFRTREYFAIYLLPKGGPYEKVIDGHPAIRGDRKLLRKLAGAYIGHGQFVQRMRTQQQALDGCITVATQHLLSERFAKGRSAWMPGWVADGFALYNMTWITGTHLSFTVDFGRYGQDPLFQSLFKESTDWLAMARELMLGKDPATLRLALGLKIGKLTPRDFLASYAFVAWLHETRTQDEVGALLRGVAGGLDIDKAFAGSLKMSVEDAEAHIKRWLRATAND